MAQSGSGYLGGAARNSSVASFGNDGSAEGRERGARRKKLAGYLKAANELRQTYQQSAAEKWAGRSEDYIDQDIPGTFPDVAIVRHGHEELILFPSYCKKHIKQKPGTASPRQSPRMRAQDDRTGTGDAEWWRGEWEKYEDDKAIVDVDVRGWVYTPHRGPMNRRNRFLVGLARQLSGIPAPKAGSRESSPDPSSLRGRHEAHEAMREAENIALEAEAILSKGEGEESIAARGGYSEDPKFDSDSESIYSSRGRRSGTQTPGSQYEDAPGPGHLHKRASWNQPADMNPAELASANTNLMARLMPFLTNPLVSTPITVFFYDENTSQSKTVVTNEAGHFNLRAALDFVPTHVRVLASENLSATEEIKITEPKGVSIISDIDDTIKHSSIGSGAREIFRNAFIRDLADLTIDGVKEWYNTMYDMGVGIHYVSNSPWQLFPVLVSFFRAAGLPPGSYHLKQYSGMLQGIFEPVAERKKGTLERIMRDFPERRFVLIGDSGEADLEVYTDVVLANPGRVIGVFIRDVTTPLDKGFFDSAMRPLSGDRLSKPKKTSSWGPDSSMLRRQNSDRDTPERRPPLPSRIRTEATPQASTGPAMGKLIDFGDDSADSSIHEPHKRILPRSNSDLLELESPRRNSAPEESQKLPPPRPAKPLALRSTASVNQTDKPTTPPPPPKSRVQAAQAESLHPLSQTQNTSEISQDQGYISAARQKVVSAYNSIPPAASYLPGADNSNTQPDPALPPRPPPRRGITATAAAYASNRLSWNNTTNNDSDDESLSNVSPSPPVNKKVDLWRRRWKRAKDILDAHGVELRSWRVGADVCVEAVQLVERNMRELGVEGYSEPGKPAKGKTGQGGGEMKVKDLKR